MTSDIVEKSPLSDREEILVEYALLLGLTGEDSPQVNELLNEYGNDPDKWAAFVTINMRYRILKRQLAQ